MRQVKARIYFSVEKEWKEVIGKFHLWGSTYEEFRDSPPVQLSVALVELEDGRIVEVIPSNLQFIDK